MNNTIHSSLLRETHKLVRVFERTSILSEEIQKSPHR